MTELTLRHETIDATPTSWELDDVLRLDVDQTRTSLNALVAALKGRTVSMNDARPLLGNLVKNLIRLGFQDDGSDNIQTLVCEVSTVLAALRARYQQSNLFFSPLSADPPIDTDAYWYFSSDSNVRIRVNAVDRTALIELARRYRGAWMLLVPGKVVKEIADADPIGVINALNETSERLKRVAFNFKVTSQQLNILVAFFRDA